MSDKVKDEVSVQGTFSRPERSVRAGRNETLQPQNIGRMTLYTFKDVLDYAYSMGFIRFGKPTIEVTQTLDKNGKPQSTAIVSVPAIFLEEGPVSFPEKGQEHVRVIQEVECWGIGDANFENTGNANIGQHFIRMAETRAKGRALAHALNLDANFVEEMGDDSAPASKPSPAPRSAPSTSGESPKTRGYPKEDPSQFPEMNDSLGWRCEETGELLKDTAQSSAGNKAMWSTRKYGRILSYNGQKALGLVK